MIARGATSLKQLQEACFKQSYNHCLTARYRLQSEAGLGTLLLALLGDLTLLKGGSKRSKGDLKSLRSTDDWKPLTRPELTLESEFLVDAGAGALDSEALGRFLASFDDESSVLRTGDRLVLFGEFSEEAKNLDEWNNAQAGLFSRLPERVGLVLSGAPAKFSLPLDDPHYLEITLPKSSSSTPDANAETVTRYALSSLHSDLPAQRDQLGVGPYAEAIARFILHPQTKAPLTFGIYGDWGKGKSSFMKLIDVELIRQAEVNAGERRRETAGETRTQRLKDLQAIISQLEPQILVSRSDGKRSDRWPI